MDVAHNTKADTENTAWWAGAGLGALSSAVPWRLSVVWTRTEIDALLSMLNYSEMRRSGGTNTDGMIAQLEYLVAPQFAVSARHHVASFVRTPVGVRDRSVHRLQLSASVAF